MDSNEFKYQDPNITVVHFKKGDVILNQDEMDRDMFIIRTGSVQIFRKYMTHRIELARLGPGEIFGEFAFFDGAPRSASAIALEACQLLRINSKEGRSVLEGVPSWVVPVFKCVFSRFREYDEKTTALLAANTVAHKHYGIKGIKKDLYHELFRCLKIIWFLNHSFIQNNENVNKKEFQDECEILIGTSRVNINVLWTQLSRLPLVAEDATYESFRFKGDLLYSVVSYLAKCVRENNMTLLTDSSLSVLRSLLSIKEKVGPEKKETLITHTVDEIKEGLSSDSDDELQELVKGDILLVKGDPLLRENIHFSWDPEKLLIHYIVQTCLKSMKTAFSKKVAA